MKYIANIDIMPKQELLDPQGKAVLLGLDNLGIDQVKDVRIGKHITMEVEADDESTANSQIETACKKLLANLIMEDYTYELKVLN